MQPEDDFEEFHADPYEKIDDKKEKTKKSKILHECWDDDDEKNNFSEKLDELIVESDIRKGPVYSSPRSG